MSNDISKAGLPVTHDEKSNIETMEQGNMPATFPGAGAASWDPEHRARVEKSMKRKLDLRCSLFVVIYIMNYLDRYALPSTLTSTFSTNHLDRNNIAAAKLKGLTEDLGIEGDEAKYQTCLSILYVGYILMQVPSNMFINTISRPSLYISIIMLLWGMVSTLSGVTHNFAGMVATRFFLGFVEAAFLPGALMVSFSFFAEHIAFQQTSKY
jgi:MFS family permease